MDLLGWGDTSSFHSIIPRKKFYNTGKSEKSLYLCQGHKFPLWRFVRGALESLSCHFAPPQWCGVSLKTLFHLFIWAALPWGWMWRFIWDAFLGIWIDRWIHGSGPGGRPSKPRQGLTLGLKAIAAATPIGLLILPPIPPPPLPSPSGKWETVQFRARCLFAVETWIKDG